MINLMLAGLIQALASSALVLFISYGDSVFAANKVPTPEIIRYRPSFPVTGMLALSDDSLLLWHGDGRAQLRDPNHGWSKPFLLPVNKGEQPADAGRLGILKIIADQRGMMLLQEPTGLEKGFSVLLVSLDNKVLEKWIIQQHPLDLKSDSDGRRVYTAEGVIELLPHAEISSPRVFPVQNNEAVNQHIPLLFDWQGATFFCRDANLSMSSYTPVQCQRLGAKGWKVHEGSGLAHPPVCGSWLLIWDEKHENRLALRSLVTGRIQIKKTFKERPGLACAEQDGIWVAGQSLELLSLPALKTRWKLPIKTGPIESIVVLNQYIAYEEKGLGEQQDIVLVARPNESLGSKP
jgi:hypothetical protein